MAFSIFFFPVSKAAHLHYFDIKRPLVIAHQGREGLAPSSTLPAFINSWKMGVIVLEFDIHMTKNGHLFATHEATVDRTTNGTGKVNKMILKEIKELDAGYYFQDEKGEHPFRGKGITIPSVEEVFSTIKDVDRLYIIEEIRMIRHL